MGQIKVLKIDTDGVPLEHSQIDEITFASFTVSGGGPVLDGNGLDMNNKPVYDVLNLLFNDPSTGYINQTVGNLIVDKIMAIDRNNIMEVSGAVIFPVISDTGSQVDSFRLPSVSGTPTAAPTYGGAGYLVYDYVNFKPYAWTGSSWDDLTTVQSAENILDSYIAGENLSAVDAVYISGSNTVSKALADATSKSRLLGFATQTKTATQTVFVQKFGKLAGFSSLTPGAREYLDPAVAGGITEIIPAGAGNTIVQAGYGVTTSVLDIQIQQLGRRS